MQELDMGTCVLITIALAFLGLLFIAKVLELVGDFREELRYLNNEIRRTVGEEQLYWIHQRRRLWLSLIPFIRY